MPHGHGLKQQTISIGVITLGTLAGKTALQLDASMAILDRTFLMKRVRYFLQLVGRTAADDGPLLVGLARGDASLQEIQDAILEANPNGPADTTQALTEDNAWIVYQNTVVAFVFRAALTEAQPHRSDWIDFGGKNGIPTQEGNGFQLFVFNARAGSLATGSSVNGLMQVQGVWLRD